MQLKILLVSYKFSPDIGGIETCSEFLANVLIEAGHVVRILTSTDNNIRDSYNYRIIRNPSNFAIIAQHFWADIIVENNPCIRLCFPKILLKKKTVTVLHTWTNFLNKNTFLEKLKSYHLRRSTKVIAVSKAMQKKCWQSSIVIGNTYNQNIFNLKVPANQRDKTFVFVGRLVSDKGAEMALEAFSHLAFSEKLPELLDSTFTIIGDGVERKRLSELIRKLPEPKRVRLLGSLTGEELAIELNKHTFQFIPSTWEEPFGIVALEGIACGLIPIASDGGGLPDAVGKAGVVFKRGHLASLIYTTRNLVIDASLQQKCLESAPSHLQNFSYQVVSRKYLEVIYSCL